MQALERRIAALEQSNYTNSDTVIFIILVGMGEVGNELVHIYDHHDNHWHREQNETEQELKDRATAGTPRKENSVTLLFGETAQTQRV